MPLKPTLRKKWLLDLARKEHAELLNGGYGPAVKTRADQVRVLAAVLTVPMDTHHLLSDAIAAAEEVIPPDPPKVKKAR